MGKGSDSPSGLQLMDLIKGHIDEILLKERSNTSDLYLYCTGAYWVAFEKSAYWLTRICRDISVMPLKIAWLPAPFVMASVEEIRLPVIVKKLECLTDGKLRKIYRMRQAVDHKAYQTWHEKKSAAIINAMRQGAIPR